MRITSPHWDEELGVCTKHELPQTPCPACIAGEGDEDLEFVVDDIDVDVIASENALGNKLDLRDLIPANIRKPTFVKGYD